MKKFFHYHMTNMQFDGLFHKKLQKHTRKILVSKLIGRWSKASRHRIFFAFHQKFNVFRRSFHNFCKNLGESFHIMSRKIIVQKGPWIFVFLNEAILSFFTYSRLQLHFKPKNFSNFILMFFKSQCRIYQRFQNCSLIQNQSILSRDIPHFLAQLLQNRHFLE